MSANDLEEVIINGVRYVRQDTRDCIEATVGGRIFISQRREEVTESVEGIELQDVQPKGDLMFQYLYGIPPGTRIRITKIHEKKGTRWKTFS